MKNYRKAGRVLSATVFAIIIAALAVVYKLSYTWDMPLIRVVINFYAVGLGVVLIYFLVQVISLFWEMHRMKDEEDVNEEVDRYKEKEVKRL